MVGVTLTVMPIGRGAASEPDPELEPDGFTEFYRRYRQPLLVYVNVSFRAVDGEAIVQETMCRALAHWTEVGHMRNPWPWLAVAARNLSRNHVRDNAGVHAVGLSLLDRPDPSPAPDERAETHETLRKVGRAARSLTPMQRELLQVLIQDGLTGAAAARQLGLSPGAGRMHLSRMRSRLTERVVGLGGELAVTPFGLLALLTRRLRVLPTTARRTLIASAPGVLMSSLAVTSSLGLVHIGIATTHAPRHEISAAPASGSGAGDGGFMRLAGHLFWDLSDGPDARPRSTASGADDGGPVVSARRHLYVAKDPMSPGRKTYVGVEVSTPYGTFVVRSTSTQHGPVLGTVCQHMPDFRCE